MKEDNTDKDVETTKAGQKTKLLKPSTILISAFIVLALLAITFINLSRIKTFYYIKRAESTMSSKKYDDSIGYCNKVLSLSNKNAEAIILKAEALEGKSDVVEAIQLLKDNIDKSDDKEAIKAKLDNVVDSLTFKKENIKIYEGQTLKMPATITALTKDKKEVQFTVKWYAKPISTDTVGTYILGGIVELINKPIDCQLDIVKFTGNTEGNINNKSNLVQKDKTIYYVNGEDNNNIYMMNIDGTIKKKLTDVKSEANLIATFCNIRLIDDVLLGTKITGYINSEYYTEVFRLSTNGENYKIISSGKYADILDVNNKEVFYKEYNPDNSSEKYFKYDIASDKSTEVDYNYLKSRNMNTGEILIANPQDKMLCKYSETTRRHEYSFMVNDKDINYNYFSHPHGELHSKDIATKEDKVIEKNIICFNIEANKLFFSNDDGIYVLNEDDSSKKKIVDAKGATDINLCDGYLTYRDVNTNYIKLVSLKDN